ncbi:MAG: hypothetical protein IPN81_14475 [Nitrosomonadales bacterium]|nr:hypothetical protein [Nitrosomonadales bacterium]
MPKRRVSSEAIYWHIYADIRDGEVVPDYAASTMQMGRSGEVMIQGHVLALKNVWKSLTKDVRCLGVSAAKYRTPQPWPCKVLGFELLHAVYLGCAMPNYR